MKSKFLFLFFFLSFSVSKTKSQTSQTFYDMNTIQTIQITFSQSNWDYMLDTAKAGSEGYIMAQTVNINGTLFDSVGVKYKGNSTYNANQVKNPFHIELDHYKNQSYQGFNDIKLSNVAKDPSFLREVLSYSILRQYMAAPLSNYSVVYVNGNQLGLYVNSEAVTKKFVDKHFYSKNNSMFKCNPPAGAGPGTTAKPNLVYNGTDSANYSAGYEMESSLAWKDLINLCDTLANNMAGLPNILDIDRAIWMLAFDNVFVNLDSYIGVFAQNYYLYEDDYNRFLSVIWDLNESLGTFSSTGTTNLTSTTAKQQLTPFLHQNDAAWPLIKNLLANARYKKMYVAHMKTILTENFGNNSYYNTALSLQSVINTAVQNDPNKFYTYTQYQNNLTMDVPTGMSSAPGLTNLMNPRYTYLMGLTDFTATQPVISNITATPALPTLNSSVTLTASVSNTNSNSVFLGYRYAIDAPFVRILMFDDGAHGDGAASDGVYGASIPVNSSFIQYYFYAENNSAGVFSPVRAEYEFYTLNAGYSTLNAGELAINEIMAVNTATVQDPSGSFPDWIELYNNTNQYLNLSNLYMSDVIVTPLKWKFPDNTIIAPYSYLGVWADMDTLQSGLHANFKLAATGEDVILSYANGLVIDQVSFPIQSANVSYERCPNGTGPFTYQTSPTYLATNCSPIGISEWKSSSFTIYPNPSNGDLNVSSNEEIYSIEIYNSLGLSVKKQMNFKGSNISLSVKDLSPGVYFIKTNQNVVRQFVKQ